MADLTHLSDEELLRLTPRQAAAFDQFYLRHERLVLGYLRKRTASSDVAIDLAAETFVAALASVKRYRASEGPAVAWLLGIARHKLLRSIQRGEVEARARRKLGAPRLELLDERLERVDQLGSRTAEELLAQLRPREAEAVRARVIEELSYPELAERMRCSALVARKHVSRGLLTLRTIVEHDDV
ncbi:RNA polymerase sigma-70 factor (ECF subfamily) [Solirubrobacter pauli]|uniref:RNA polymerase sigma-70 factor (ECF subfamily) n=1 Tax=Solirubrobacter pauli TaxID=166793 RepID=A0A660KWL2_9ACTN|nr:RNA polymerase sigma factor [Solirubrobacter pauli]RKQ84835.1 RNA polymerase sigma-70 factor (ECF subfamily) [Solirubrobacter pauli]